MTRDKVFTVFYGHIEVLVDLSSGFFLMFGTHLFLEQYIPGFTEVISSPAGAFLARSFGLMVVISGLLQYAIINFGNRKTRRYGLMGLAFGDFMQIVVSALFFMEYGEWDFLNIFNFIFTPGLIISRIYFLVTGVPGRK
jgi:ABC-type thiamin/hydroxymethylpyrimidine transport system permease subunit